MEVSDEEINYSDVIENLTNMFGNVMSKDIIIAVVEECGGDLNLSVDAIMNMTSEVNVPEQDDRPPPTNQEMDPISMPQKIDPKPSPSYASAAQSLHNAGAIPKKLNIQRPCKETQCFWTDQIRQIITNHNQGYRMLILMRGATGSGKSYMAKQLIDMMIGAQLIHYNTHIFSTDDYFMARGQYHYEKHKLSEAHSWNQRRVREAARLGLSPIIVDNTNIELWEMEPYVRDGHRNGYIIEVVEPNTPWARKAHLLFKKSTHNVPLVTIRRMLDNYKPNVTGERLKNTFGLYYYPANMTPPIKRTMPPILAESSTVKSDEKCTIATNSSTVAITRDQNITDILPTLTPTLNPFQQAITIIQNREEQQKDENSTADIEKEEESVLQQREIYLENEEDDLLHLEETKQKFYMEAQKRLEEMEKVEEEWENGEHWEDDNNERVMITRNNMVNPMVSEAKPQRQCGDLSTPQATYSESTAAEQYENNLMETVNDCKDWRKISMFMPPWASPVRSSSASNHEVPVVTISCGTCMEIGDTNINGNNKVIAATPRNINEYYTSLGLEKIPEKRMLDKSSMTNEGIMTEAVRCSNEEKHFIAFRKLFKNIARSDLRDIFDNCCGDVNWAVGIVLDGTKNNMFKSIDTEDLSDLEEETLEQCECLANYNIIPDAAAPEAVQPSTPKYDCTAITANVVQKKKRDVNMSEENIQIKRQIEQNVVISDDHYSKHCLKIRKYRRGEQDTSDNNLEEPSTSGISNNASDFKVNFNSPLDVNASDEEDDSVADENDHDRIINVNLGKTLVAELDKLFFRADMEYPANIVPKVSMPMSMLNELNALWMESLMHQLDCHAQNTAAMIQQDEEFAREIAKKEEEMFLAGKEPEVPDFKEIMDMDLALNLYQKEVGEWRNNMPTDIAAKMSRDKLFNLFPDVDQDVLAELLMAHDNNFNDTVEGLLMSTGRNDILEEENGINKFIVAKEMERKDQLLKEQRKELSETEWPLLSKGHKVELATVTAYREEADQHLARRNLSRQKAEDCIRRGMPQVANYYSEIADFHRQKYEQANSLAVASLMQYHAQNHPDCKIIDLHYLRVKESKESLDIFIDSHISKLRDGNNPHSVMLFFITGRGVHSNGYPRVKPATIQRLKQRGLKYKLCNPGLLSTTVTLNTKLTYEVP